MPRLLTKMPTFDQFSANNTSTVQLPVGRRYHALKIPQTGLLATEITEIRVSANSQVFQRYSGVDLDNYNVLHGNPAIGSEIFIPFDRPDLLQRSAMESTALNTGVPGVNGERAITALQVEIDIGADVAPLVSKLGPVLAIQSEPLRDSAAGVTQSVLRIEKGSQAIAAAGEIEIDNLAFGDLRHAFMESVLFSHGGSASHLEVRANGFSILDKIAQVDLDALLTQGARTPRANVLAYGGSLNRYGGDMLETVGLQDLRFLLTMTAGATVNMLTAYIGALDSV